MSKLGTSLGVAALLMGVASAPQGAVAADLGGNCCADLEERIAELEATTVRKGNRKVKLEVSGFINEALLWWHDGDDSRTNSPTESEDSNIYQGTNDVQRSRFRFKGEAKINDDWKTGFLLELGLRANRLTRTDERTDEGGSEIDLRYSAWYVDNKKLGRVWLGNTSVATDAITELNTANLTHFARFSASKWNMSNRIIVNGVRSADRRWRDLLPTDGASGDNVPGEGDRGNLIRYESPKWQGFQLQTAWGEDDFWDVALRYAGELGGFKVLAGVGYAKYSDDNFDPNDANAASPTTDGHVSMRGCASGDPQPATVNNPGFGGGSDNDCETLGASLSAMHSDSGLFLTLAGGFKDDNLRQALFANRTPVGIQNIDDRDWFWGVMGGLEKKWVDLGKTTLYGEFAHFEAGAQIGDTEGNIRTFNSAFPSLGGGDNFSRGSHVEYWGIGLNQHVEKAAMDLYLGYRHYEGEIALSDTDTGAAQSFDIVPLDLVLTGAKIQF